MQKRQKFFIRMNKKSKHSKDLINLSGFFFVLQASLSKSILGICILLFPPLSLAVTSGELRTLLEKPVGRLAKIESGGGVVYETLPMDHLYRARYYEPLWIRSHRLTPLLSEARFILQNSYQQGLVAEHFWSAQMEGFYEVKNRNENTVGGLKEIEFELLVSEALIRYARSIYIGQVDPSLVDDDIKIKRKTFKEEELERLRLALEGNGESLSSVMESFEPQIPLYKTLKKKLAQEFPSGSITTENHRKIIATMEKLRWLPNSLGPRYAFVNLAMTQLKVVENDQTVLEMKTINGKSVRRTPMMIDVMKTVILNPDWTVPHSLSVNDKLPELQKKGELFLQENRLRVYSSADLSTPLSDISSIDWNQLSRSKFPYILKEDPGPQNVLGKVKFPLTNGFAIYLHDTNERPRFKAPAPRLESSGCVRLQKPMEMATYLLKDQTVPLGQGWKVKGKDVPLNTNFTEAILMSRVATVNTPREEVKSIPMGVSRPLPIYLAYLTADVDSKGEVHYIKDYYHQDSRLLSILENIGMGSNLKLVDKSAIHKKTKLVPVKIEGELGPTQLFGTVTALRCTDWSYKGCLKKKNSKKLSREEYQFKLNETTELPQGYYMLSLENSMLPGWLSVLCRPEISKPCSTISLTLEKIILPEDLSQAAEVFIYRDFSSLVEKNKILAQSFYNGQALVQQTPISDANFYLPGINQRDVVKRLNTDYCETKSFSSKLSREAVEFCERLKKVTQVDQYLQLPFLLDREGKPTSSSPMTVFHFPSANKSPEDLNTQTWVQRWVDAPGNGIYFSHRRYLVAAPLFPRNTPASSRFVSVFPGQYRILALDDNRMPLASSTAMQTPNIQAIYGNRENKIANKN